MSTQIITKNIEIDHHNNTFNTEGIVVNAGMEFRFCNFRALSLSLTIKFISIMDSALAYIKGGQVNLTGNNSLIDASGATSEFEATIEDSVIDLSGAGTSIVEYNYSGAGTGNVVLNDVTINGDGTGKLVNTPNTNGNVLVRLNGCYMNPSIIDNSPLGSHLNVIGTFSYYDGSNYKSYICNGTGYTEIGSDPNAASVLGFTMQGEADINGQILSNPADPTAGNHVGDRDYNDGRYLKSGLNETSQNISGNAFRFYVADGYFTYTYDNVNKTLEMVFTAN